MTIARGGMAVRQRGVVLGLASLLDHLLVYLVMFLAVVSNLLLLAGKMIIWCVRMDRIWAASSSTRPPIELQYVHKMELDQI